MLLGNWQWKVWTLPSLINIRILLRESVTNREQLNGWSFVVFLEGCISWFSGERYRMKCTLRMRPGRRPVWYHNKHDNINVHAETQKTPWTFHVQWLYTTFCWIQPLTHVSIWYMNIILFYKLEYNCFTVLCEFLLYSEVNQPYVYIYPLPLGPPFHSHPHPTHLGHHRAPSWAPCAVQQVPTSYQFYTW